MPGIAGLQLRKRIALQSGSKLAEMFGQGFRGGRVEVDKNKTFPRIDPDRSETEPVFFEIAKTLFIRNESQAAVETIAPAVKFTRKVLTRPLLIPDDLIAPVGTHIMERMQGSVPAARQDNRRITDGQVFDKIVPRPRKLFNTTHIEPSLLIDAFPLQLEILR